MCVVSSSHLYLCGTAILLRIRDFRWHMPLTTASAKAGWSIGLCSKLCKAPFSVITLACVRFKHKPASTVCQVGLASYWDVSRPAPLGNALIELFLLVYLGLFLRLYIFRITLWVLWMKRSVATLVNSGFIYLSYYYHYIFKICYLRLFLWRIEN